MLIEDFFLSDELLSSYDRAYTMNDEHSTNICYTFSDDYSYHIMPEKDP